MIRSTLVRRSAPRRRRAPSVTPQTLRTRVAIAFEVLANGADPTSAQAQSTGFYRASGMAWARPLV